MFMRLFSGHEAHLNVITNKKGRSQSLFRYKCVKHNIFCLSGPSLSGAEFVGLRCPETVSPHDQFAPRCFVPIIEQTGDS